MENINADLIQRCKARDEKALHLLYRESYSLMKSIVLRYVFDQNEVADVLNRGFVKVANGLKSYDINKPLAPWIATVMVNESPDYVRRTLRAKVKEEPYRL